MSESLWEKTSPEAMLEGNHGDGNCGTVNCGRVVEVVVVETRRDC